MNMGALPNIVELANLLEQRDRRSPRRTRATTRRTVVDEG
jgi:hypothetical protein